MRGAKEHVAGFRAATRDLLRYFVALRTPDEEEMYEAIEKLTKPAIVDSSNALDELAGLVQHASTTMPGAHGEAKKMRSDFERMLVYIRAKNLGLANDMIRQNIDRWVKIVEDMMEAAAAIAPKLGLECPPLPLDEDESCDSDLGSRSDDSGSGSDDESDMSDFIEVDRAAAEEHDSFESASSSSSSSDDDDEDAESVSERKRSRSPSPLIVEKIARTA